MRHTDTERLDAMVDHGWSVSGPVNGVYTVFAGESGDIACYGDPRTAIDLAMDQLEME